MTYFIDFQLFYKSEDRHLDLARTMSTSSVKYTYICLPPVVGCIITSIYITSLHHYVKGVVL